MLSWCSRRMKIVVLALCLAAFATPAALAKGQISVVVGDSTPRAGQAFPVTVRTGYVVPANDWLRLIAVAPGKGWYDVVGTVTGDSSLAHANIPHDGFAIKLVRVEARTWRAVVRLPRPERHLRRHLPPSRRKACRRPRRCRCLARRGR